MPYNMGMTMSDPFKLDIHEPELNLWDCVPVRPRVYIAGKINVYGDWREEVVGTDIYLDLEQAKNGWPVKAGSAGGYPFLYVGPYLVDLGHGHIYGHEVDHHTGYERVASLCYDAIQDSTLVFARLDDKTAYGTIMEVGQSVCGGKRLVMVYRPMGEMHLIEAWPFVETSYLDSWKESFVKALGLVWNEDNTGLGYEIGEWIGRETGSPVEQKFWMEAMRDVYGYRLLPQYPINGFRVDFKVAHHPLVIELDGHDYHKTKEQREHDYKREREIQRQGYQVIRFTGTEVHNDVENCLKEVKLLADRV